MTETILSKEIRIAIARDGRALVLRNNVAMAVPYGRPDARPVQFGLGRGSPDLIGVLIGSGRAFALEVKIPSGRVHQDQARSHAIWRRRGVFVAVVRSVPEAIDAVTRAIAGASE